MCIHHRNRHAGEKLADRLHEAIRLSGQLRKVALNAELIQTRRGLGFVLSS
ncbi:MAG: hypothetical protein ACRDH2_07410 [Anaerolineales bacterium]